MHKLEATLECRGENIKKIIAEKELLFDLFYAIKLIKLISKCLIHVM